MKITGPRILVVPTWFVLELLWLAAMSVVATLEWIVWMFELIKNGISTLFRKDKHDVG